MFQYFICRRNSPNDLKVQLEVLEWLDRKGVSQTNFDVGTYGFSPSYMVTLTDPQMIVEFKLTFHEVIWEEGESS
jgi:hypothetical protein